MIGNILQLGHVVTVKTHKDITDLFLARCHGYGNGILRLCWFSLKWNEGALRLVSIPPFGRGFSRHRYVEVGKTLTDLVEFEVHAQTGSQPGPQDSACSLPAPRLDRRGLEKDILVILRELSWTSMPS